MLQFFVLRDDPPPRARREFFLSLFFILASTPFTMTAPAFWEDKLLGISVGKSMEYTYEVCLRVLAS